MQTFEQWWNEIEGYGLRAERFTTPGDAAEAAWDQAMSLRAQADARPVAWVRFCSDGGIEGPILDSSKNMCDVRRNSGAWTPLYTHPEASAPGLDSAIALLKRLKRDLMHARRFGPDMLQAYKNACVRAEGDVEEWLIENRDALTRASAASVAEPSSFRASVEAMVRMLEEGEWAEHVAATTGKGDPLAQRLETAITGLINETHGDAE